MEEREGIVFEDVERAVLVVRVQVVLVVHAALAGIGRPFHSSIAAAAIWPRLRRVATRAHLHVKHSVRRPSQQPTVDWDVWVACSAHDARAGQSGGFKASMIYFVSGRGILISALLNHLGGV